MNRKILCILAFGIASATNFVNVNNIQYTMLSQDSIVYRKETPEHIISICKLGAQTKDFAFNKGSTDNIDILRIHVSNKSRRICIFDICDISDIKILSKRHAFNMLSLSHSYIRDIALYFAASSLCMMLLTRSISNAAAFQTITGLFAINITNFRLYTLSVSLIPPLIKTIMNIASHKQELNIFQKFYKTYAHILPEESINTLLFVNKNEVSKLLSDISKFQDSFTP
ncbi:MAG: hypothetical protein KAH32_02360 [Chlamydiia bacterium]|nr:hypothetical protein [Chlamydiia bacterium]